MSPPRLLFVEDEILIQIVAEEDLKLHGFDVVVAGTAQAALDAAKKESGGFAAAIIDVGLPDRGGDALASDLRAMAATLPIVIVSGYDKDVLGERFTGDPLVQFLRKPYRSPQLIAALASVNVTPSK
jgi:DNA-binding response OmpR family regulator